MHSFDNQYFKPIAPWTGRLLASTKESRHLQGGVVCELTNTPVEYHHLKGKCIWLIWLDQEPEMGWLEKIKMDIHFSPDIQRAKEKGNLYPESVNGLKNVSALEILSSLSAHDAFDVIIHDPQVDENDNQMITYHEPTQILGVEHALIRFIHPCNHREDLWKIRHYHPISHAFTGPEHIVNIIEPITLSQCPIALTSLKNIHLSPLNTLGWYAYGIFSKDTFVIKGLEPRSLLQLKHSHAVYGLSSAREYLKKGNWDEKTHTKGSLHTVGLYPNKEESSSWKEGEQYLLLHLLGPFQGENELKLLNYMRRYTIKFFAELTCFLRAGHFSFGIATIIKDPFTEELKFDITYHQVLFAHMIPRFSGSQKWHKFMGSLQSGSMFLRPTSDIIISMPELNRDYHVNDKKWQPLNALRNYLEKITSLSRRGTHGEGGLHFDLINTCTRESSQAFFHLIEELSQMDHDHSDLKKLHQFCNIIKKRLIATDDDLPMRWQSNTSGKIDCPVSNSGIKKMKYAFSTRKVSFPKDLQEHIAEACLEVNSPLWILKTNMIGGTIEGLYPRKPNASFSQILASLGKDLLIKMKLLNHKKKS